LIPFDQPVSIGRAPIDIDADVAAVVHDIIDEGWAIACRDPAMSATLGEVPTTELLRDGMRAALRTPESRASEVRKEIVVMPGAEWKSDANMTRPTVVLDIPLYFIRYLAEEHDPHATIECKRLAAGVPKLARQYVVQGIDRYCRRHYADNQSRAFMVGYVIAGTAPDAVADVNNYLAKKGRQGEALVFQHASLSGGRWQSSHPRNPAPVPIVLHHAVLTVVSQAVP
jgi:hypothetical protein